MNWKMLHWAVPIATLAAKMASAQVISLQLPAELQSTQGAVQVALIGQGMCLQIVEIQSQETRINIEELAQQCGKFHDLRPVLEIKMLTLVPGTGVETFSGPAINETWRPNLVLLPVVRVHGRLEPPPPVGSTVRFSYGSGEGMRFFSYFDGSPPEIAIGTTTIGVGGQFSLSVPNIAADTFVESASGTVDIHVVLAGDSARPYGEHWTSMPLEEFYSSSPLLVARDAGR